MSDEKKDLSIKNMIKVEEETIKEDNPLVKIKKQEQWKRSVLNDIRSFIKLYEPFKINFEKRAENLMKSANENEKKTGEYFYLVLGYVKLIEEKRVTYEEIEKELNKAIYT
jgi:predicted nucleic acid-binding protein